MLIYLQDSSEFKLERKHGRFYLSRAKPDAEQYEAVGNYAALTEVLDVLAFYAVAEQEAVSLREVADLIRSVIRDLENAVAAEMFG